MFLWLSKAVEWLLTPLAWSLLFGLAAALLRRRSRAAWALGGAGLAVLLAFSSAVVADAIQRAAERGAKSTFRPDFVYDAVIVLGGMVDSSATRASGTAELTESADRIVRGFEIVRAGRARNVIVSAGVVFPVPGDVPEADLLAAMLARWGVPPGQIVVEAASRNTRENAIEIGRVASARGWKSLLLVTSAAHVPRALGCFRAVGLEPDVLPVDFRAGDGRGRSWLPQAGALVKSTRAIHELAGRLAYRLAGYTR
ncbi:MAG TPA: YdcF family protein [Anaeromyxobacter sp.]